MDSQKKAGSEDLHRYRAHVVVSVRTPAADEEVGITLESPLSLQAAEAAVTVALAVIRTAGEIDPAVLVAGRQLLEKLPRVLDRMVDEPQLMPVDIRVAMAPKRR